jgi:hypothetical protein
MIRSVNTNQEHSPVLETKTLSRQERWRLRNPAKYAAQQAVSNYVKQLRRRGISKPNCQCCNKSESQVKAEGRQIDAHHTDYKRPLDVTWLCDRCHITGHWENSWRTERNGKKAVIITRTVVVEEK